MSDLLNLILTEIKEIKSTVTRMEKKLDSIQEQVVKNSEDISYLKPASESLNTFEHHLEVLDKQVRNNSIEISKLKSK